MTHSSPSKLDATQRQALRQDIQQWGKELGFQQVGFSNVDLGQHEEYLNRWLSLEYQGEMDYMSRHGTKRSRPAELIPGTLSIISVRMDYMAPDIETLTILNNPSQAYVSRYALGRDYHKVLRKRLTQLAKRIQETIGPYGFRAFVDSAPVLEKAIAEKAGLGWIGKNTLLLNRKAGSYYFLGELYTDLPLLSEKTEEPEKPTDSENEHPIKNHCGRCTACIDLCPTKAIIGPYQLDARRCISYLTIEYKGSIPKPLRPLMGNRIFGCDDCQLVCPWNRFAQQTKETDFHPRHNLDKISLCDLFSWDQPTFEKRTEGSPIRRSGYECWLRNIAIGLGNCKTSPEVISALTARLNHPSALVREHVEWALTQHQQP